MSELNKAAAQRRPPTAARPTRTTSLAATGAPSLALKGAIVAGSALFLQSLDEMMVATALPSMAAPLGQTPLAMSAVMTSYLLAMTVLTPVSGWIADRFGPRLVFLAAIALFGASALACAMADSIAWLLAARLAQGAAGAMLAPVGRILIVRGAGKSQLVGAMAYLAVPSVIGLVIGPAVGGFVVVNASWRWIFLLDVPIALLVLLAAARVIGRDKETAAPPFDFRGSILSGAALVCLIAALDASSRPAVSPQWTLVAGVIGLLCGIAYLWHAHRSGYPVLDLRLFRIPTFAISLSGAALCRLSVGALPFLLALLLQIRLGLDAFRAGTLASAVAVGSLVVQLAASHCVRQFGFRPVMLASAIFGGLLISSCAWFTSASPLVAIPLTLFGIGFFRSLQLTVASTLGYADVPESSVSASSSLAGTIQYLASAAGVAIAASSVHIGTLIRSGHDAFDVGFIVIGTLFLGSSLVFARLRPDSGAELRPAKARG